MPEFNWRFSFTFLLILLRFQEISGQESYLVVKVDDEVTLPCLNVIKTQTECRSTTWHFTHSRSSPVTELVKNGAIGDNAKADRLSVAADCSLTIKKATLKDVGQYSCRQYNGLNQSEGPDAAVYLSIMNIHEDDDDDKAMLKCSVLTYEDCGYTVEWLYDRDKNSLTSLKRSNSLCSASLTLNTPVDQSPEKPKCKVTDRHSGSSFLLCYFSQQSSCEETDPPRWWFYIIVAASAALIITVGLIIRLRRTKGQNNKPQKDDSFGLNFNPVVIQPSSETSQDTADTEGGVSYASISYTKKTNGKAKGKGDNEEEDAVMYSTVKISPEDSTDPSNIYATVNKSKKEEKITV